MRKSFPFLAKFFWLCLVLTCCKGKEFTAVFETPKGPMRIDLELAMTPEAQRRGLMFRDRLGERQGMLFCFGEDRKPAFWMKNTYLSLDLLFLSSGGMVVDVLERLPPCPQDPCPNYVSDLPARYALEVTAGFARKHGVKRGDRVHLEIPETCRAAEGGKSGTVRREESAARQEADDLSRLSSD